MARMPDLFSLAAGETHDQKPYASLWLMQGVVAAWSKLAHPTAALCAKQPVPLAVDVVKQQEIIDALRLLPDETLVTFLTWFYQQSPEELQTAALLAPETAEERVSFFNLLGSRLCDEDELSQCGAIFTPHWLTAELTRRTLGHWRKLNLARESPALVGDLSCGAGAFLIELSKRLAPTSTIVGVDKNPAFACLARLATLERPDILIEVRDTLLDIQQQASVCPGSPSRIPASGYDLLLGNPPYVRSQALPARYAARLKHRYPGFTRGNFDLAVLFLVHTLQALAPGGIGALVVSNKFMTSRYGSALCHELAERARILEIVNFGDGQVFAGRTTYTCTITFARLPPARHFSLTSFPPGLAWRADALHFDVARRTELPSARLFSHPWDLSSNSSNEILQRMQTAGLPGILDVFRGLCQGVRTGANQVFLVNQHEAAALEVALVQPHAHGQQIKRCQILPAEQYLLSPYRAGEHAVEIIPPEVLERDFPALWRYLLRWQEVLAARKLDPGLPWYGYSRVQNLLIGRQPKILVKEMMPRAEFAADTRGRFAISAGYALLAPPEMTAQNLELWAAILSTPTMEFQYRLVGTQLQSGWFRLLAHHLKKVRLPLFQGPTLAQAHRLVAQLGEHDTHAEIWEQLDTLVAQCFGLTPTMQRTLHEVLHGAHTISRPTAHPGEALAKHMGNVVNTAYPELSDEQRRLYIPVELPRFNAYHVYRDDFRQAVTFVPNKGIPVHNWYPYTQGYSALLVEKLIEELAIQSTETVYDPFAGCGTTLLVCRARGIPSFGREISPLMSWVTSLKTTCWNTARLEEALELLKRAQPASRSDEQMLFPEYFQQAYAPAVLAQLVGWRDWMRTLACEDVRDFLLLGLVSMLEEVSYIRKHGSHYRYLNRDENEHAGLKKLNIPLVAKDLDVGPLLIARIAKMIEDTRRQPCLSSSVPCEIFSGDARGALTSGRQADVVITSPPYVNRNNYIAQQKAELSLLRLLASYDDYRRLVQSTLRSHVEGDLGTCLQTTIPEVARILDAFTLTPNNNAKIPQMIAGYFEDLRETLERLFAVVRPGGRLAFVVGNSRWGGVVVPVDHLLALLAERQGFRVERLLVTRLKGNSPQQMQRYGRIPVRESIVVLRRP
ncbi:MAG TPA: N-6 DNA methylase [Ktedonobacteraceae bacterium]|jgi:methylase of polypeptide subunit release factors